MNTSEQIGEIAKALATAQGEFANVVRDLVAAVGDSYSYSYADLGACLEVVRRPLANNGLSVVQPASTENGDVVVGTRLIHESGQWLDFGELRMSPQKAGPQALGSCITYARRYALASALGIAQTDDDGNGAESHAEKTAPMKSMHTAIQKIDACSDYEAFKKAWKELDKSMREEISKRKPKQIEIWKARFRDDADHDQTREDGAEANQDGASATVASN